MITTTSNTSLVKNTTHKVVIPFYVYAAVSFLAATVLLFLSTGAFTKHHFHPHTLAITHTMVLGWGTMIILGASHQLVPVLIEARLASVWLAHISFYLAAVGIPLLVYSFYYFNFDLVAETGALLINASILVYLVNLSLSMYRSKKRNVHAVFVLTAATWLLVTTLVGLLLVCNFTGNFLPKDSLQYLSLHAHIGIIGWFLMLVMGVGSRLIPMFLISKYDDPKRLWLIYCLVNASLVAFIIIFFSSHSPSSYLVPVAGIVAGIVLFARFCWKAYKLRIRKQVDEQVRLSLLSVAMMAIPLLVLLVMIALLVLSDAGSKLVLVYGFSIFFGWLTAIILGMTFKTLPFIVWNKVYHEKSGLGKTPNPKDLFNDRLFNIMGACYLAGFMAFTLGILLVNTFILQLATVFLLITAILYNWNIMQMLFHKPLMK